MKTIVQFDLPDDEPEHKLFSLRWPMYEAITQARMQVRTLLKHGDISETERLHLDGLRSTLYEGLDLLE